MFNKNETRLAAAVPASRNRKIGVAHATYAAQQSCPDSCALKGRGCYAEGGRVGGHWSGFTKAAAAAGATAADIARAEAAEIDSLPATHDLRIHVAGDCSTPEAAEIVGAAASRYRARRARTLRASVGMGAEAPRPWTYTHAWADVDRDAWGADVSVLASVHSDADADAAEARGYAVARTVVSFADGARAVRRADGGLDVPCPEQARGMQCVRCRLCFDSDRLRERKIRVLFAIHGQRKRAAREAVGQ